ncbi:MAG: hypothetical protein AB1486_18875 [Planctomycetota bacterium]
METLQATLKDGRKVQFLPEVVVESGGWRVHRSRDARWFVCFYADQHWARATDRMRHLEAMLGPHNLTFDPDLGDYWTRFFVWPTAIVIEPGLGVMAPWLPLQFFFASGPHKGERKEAYWFVEPERRRALLPSERGSWLDRLQLSALLARSTKRLHRLDMCLNSFCARDLLVDPPGHGVLFFRWDNIVLPGQRPLSLSGSPGYTAPEIHATQHLSADDPNRAVPSRHTDRFSLAVFIYQFLMGRHPLQGMESSPGDAAPVAAPRGIGDSALGRDLSQHAASEPSGRADTSRLLGPFLETLIERGFGEGLRTPQRRPSAAEWEVALRRTEDLVVPCGHAACSERWFVQDASSKIQCPWCGWTSTEGVPLLRLESLKSSGQPTTEPTWVFGWPGRTLHAWHLDPTVVPDEKADPTPCLRIARLGKQWLLVNEALDSVATADGSSVPHGHAAELKRGARLLLSSSRFVEIHVSGPGF